MRGGARFSSNFFWACIFLGVPMKKLLIGLVTLIGLGGSALAADLPMKAPPMAPPPFDWGGLYVGGSMGWFGSHSNWQYTNPGPATLQPFSINASDFAFGVHGGAQWQFGQIVLGVDADYTIPSAT